MKSRILPALVLATVSVLSAPSFAEDRAQQDAAEVIQLKDGGTLFVFRDGKMAKEDKYGRAANLTIGEKMITKDGRVISANSNEIARLHSLLREGHQN